MLVQTSPMTDVLDGDTMIELLDLVEQLDMRFMPS